MSVPQRALAKAQRDGLLLDAPLREIPTSVFSFHCLEPKPENLNLFREVLLEGLPWVDGIPFPVVTYNVSRNEWRIMDGMLRICTAQAAGFTEIPAFVASGETYEALAEILDEGYYGEDFVEMLSMVNPGVAKNMEARDQNRMAGK